MSGFWLVSLSAIISIALAAGTYFAGVAHGSEKERRRRAEADNGAAREARKIDDSISGLGNNALNERLRRPQQ